MVIQLSFVCFWQLQVYPLTNARPFFLLFGCYEFFILLPLYGLGKIAKSGHFANFRTLGFRYCEVIYEMFHIWNCGFEIKYCDDHSLLVFVIFRSLSRSFIHKLNLKKI